MKLYEAGRVQLDDPLSRYLPDYAAGGKGTITIRQLLSHSSGLRSTHPFHELGVTTSEAILDFLRRDSLESRPGAEARYSDLGMILLGLVVERASGQPLGTYLDREVFGPLGMVDTGFREVGPGAFDPTIAPTEEDLTVRGRTIQGEVHDLKAHMLGGTAGHAGLFSTARDLGRFARTMANGGLTPDGKRFLRPETIELFTRPVIDDRALGWQVKSDQEVASAGARLGPRSFGHTGFTGTSLWIDPDRRLFTLILSNAVHPRRRDQQQLNEIRAKATDLAVEATRAVP
jgi:CubicO group peptidase (beta-lactamase class C family)